MVYKLSIFLALSVTQSTDDAQMCDKVPSLIFSHIILLSSPRVTQQGKRSLYYQEIVSLKPSDAIAIMAGRWGCTSQHGPSTGPKSG